MTAIKSFVCGWLLETAVHNDLSLNVYHCLYLASIHISVYLPIAWDEGI